MVRRPQHLDSEKRSPRQARARATIAAILEAAARILEERGLDGFTTNHVAERAGVGIATLYQYFPDKEAIVLAIAEQERDRLTEALGQILARASEAGREATVRAIVRMMVQAFEGRRRARKAIVETLMRRHGGAMAGWIARVVPGLMPGMVGTAGSTRSFVVSRAITGVVRSAVLEESPLLETPEFEDELVRLVLRYLD
jgi:AcrR family transcriptional regulator